MRSVVDPNVVMRHIPVEHAAPVPTKFSPQTFRFNLKTYISVCYI